jgi:hypothetical protein
MLALEGRRNPFAAELFRNLFVWDRSASLDVGPALSHRLNDVQMIKHIVQTAIIWEPVQQGPYCLFRGLQKPLPATHSV